MKRSPILLLIAFSTIYMNGCGEKTTINENEATAVITDYLESNPEYKTITFYYGEMKFREQKDQMQLRKYQALEEKGYISMSLKEQKKLFLSKDSTFTYEITLTDLAAPFVLEQGKDKATVKAVNYILDDAKPVNFIKTNNKTAKATVSLKRMETDFFPFDKSKTTYSEFITKTYKLKLKKEEGWIVDGK